MVKIRAGLDEDYTDAASVVITAGAARRPGEARLELVRSTASILRKQHSVLTVSTMLNGEFGISDVCLSVPCVVTGTGVSLIIPAPLSESELLQISRSAEILKKSYWFPDRLKIKIIFYRPDS